MSGLTFDADTHTYFHNGRRLPSVTSILRPVMPDYSYADTSLGTAVHEVLELHDRGDDFAYLTFAALRDGAGPDVSGHFEQWERFLADYDAVWFAIEERVHSSLFGYAGTLDRRGRLEIGGQACAAIVDIKTGEPDRWHGLQLAGYALACNGGPTTYRRFCVYLSADTYRVREYTDPADFVAFQAAVTLNHWMDRK